MTSTSGFHLLDYLEFIVKRRRMFVLVFLTSLVTSYVSIYFLIEEQYEATATIIPREDESSNLAGNMLRGMKSVPISLGATSPSAQIDLYKTIIYSRTMMENVVRKFNLISIYKLDTLDIACMEKAIKRLSGEVQTKETEESAFLVVVRANSRQRAADMTNFIVQALNDRVVDLQVSRSRDNKLFLETRVQELSKEIKVAEDSLQVYQEKTGMFDIKSQLEGILATHATLETEFAGKQLQLSVMEKMLNGDAPEVSQLKIQVHEYEKKLRELRSEGDPGSPLLPLKSIPSVSVGFLNRFREVEIDNLLLEYIMPLYEQAKIEEKKDFPILQIIDYAVPPARKSYPPRVLFSLIGAIFVTISLFVGISLRDKLNRVQDPRWIAIFGDLRQWNWTRKKPR